MDPPSIVKSFKYSSTAQQQPQPMFSVSVEPTLPLHYRSQHNNSSQDASFSSYLKSNDPVISQKPQENVVDDTEISIFDAQKYFSENSDHKEMKKQQVPEPHDDMLSSVDGYGRNFRTRSFHATPTASSEASWNSQTGLLANPPGSVGVSLRNFNSDDKRRSSAARKWMFGRKCCCTGKKSVEVKEATTTSDSEHGGPVINNNVKSNFLYANAKRDSYKSKQSSSSTTMSMSTTSTLQLQRSSITNDKVGTPNSNSFPSPDPDPPRQQRISASGVVGGFSFPILNNSNNQTQQSLKGIITKPPINIIINPLEDPPRDSLEVFQPMHEVASRFNNPPGSMDDDVASDASSDLFEIESFSTQTTSYPMYRRRDSLDEAPTFNVRRFAAANGINLNNNNNSANIQYGRRSLDEPPTPSVAATECYAPSEVSIDWSVTTAEGFDRASVSNFSVSASEIGSAALLRQRMQEEALGKKKGNGGGGGGLLLMSCRQEKAVSVGPQPVKCEGGGALMVYPAHAGGRPPRANKPAMGTDHSARLSLAFAA
ncbi:hypothetical protein C2S53_003284 [Perilla frutescens var. hirtella]|uniref:Protein PHYTOCHROME KINASE SUBSTRATE 4 n=1 Tax=Perilla frutescens var. hirtella TaxID=608512 RepID=A0AAD4NZE8_PERFH|nr:hypothetical protein C2S53_003284 [Perilla frutescens var. hirtella]